MAKQLWTDPIKRKISRTNHKRSKRGFITRLYHSIIVRKKDIEFDLNFLWEFSHTNRFDRLYNEWIKSGYKSEFKPSLDRINHKFGYLKRNIQWLTWGENYFKKNTEIRHKGGRVCQIKDGEIIATYISKRHAHLVVGVSVKSLCHHLQGLSVHCGGYQWQFESKLKHI